MFKIIAAKFMTLLTFALSPSNIELPQDPRWLKVENKQPNEKYEIDIWENEDLIYQCKKNPDAFIFIPPIYIANQEIWDERKLV